MSPGPAVCFIKALRAVNAKLKMHYPESEELFKVVLIHDNSDLTSRISKNHNLEDIITPLCVSEENLIHELQENNTHLYLSAPPGLTVQKVMSEGIAAAIMFRRLSCVSSLMVMMSSSSPTVLKGD
ncbi:cytosolic 5'-nucleotidase 1A-like [Trachinotus anak]|uniref:cytosolic 5'-nucleotidase 1A-like n=1 Tax=Trachinotus anak TaxID=443729 RepID=UPI0039F1BCBF